MLTQDQRDRVIAEAGTWIGTPFRDCADVKGPLGGVDCAMLLVRCFVDTGALSPFDPRPYPAQWHLHHSQELFLESILTAQGGIEVEKPEAGDVALYQFGRTFSHGALIVDPAAGLLIHAFYKTACVTTALMTDIELSTIAATDKPRPVKFFSIRGVS